MAVTDLGFAHRVFTLVFAYLLLSPTLVASQRCYDPSGGLLIGFGICNNASSISLCCPVYNQCMSNGLCLNALSGNFNRGGCTDKSFNDLVCPSFCITEAFPEVLPCNSTTTQFCCDSQNSGKCCQDPKTFLTIDPAVSSADAVSATTASTSAPSAASSTSSFTTTSGTSPSPSATPAVASPGRSYKGGRVGFAVGLTVGIGAILAFAFYLCRRRRRARSATEKEDDIPELPSQLPDNALNSKLFPAELDPEGEGLKGPAELDPKPLLPSRGPAELAVIPAELPAEPVDPEYGAEEYAREGSTETTAVGSRVPSFKKDNHLFPTTSSNEPSALVSSISPPAQGQLGPAENTQPISQLQTPTLRRSPSSPDQASSPQSDQEPHIPPPPPPPPPSLATRPSTASTTPQSSPTRGHAGRLGKGVVVVHPNNQNWSLEQEQTKALSPRKEPEGLRRPQTIAERRNVGSPDLNSSSGPWFDAYDAKTAEARP